MTYLYLTAEDLSVINDVVIECSGGSKGLREPELLESIAFKPQSYLSGSDLYPDLYLKAAVLYEALVNYHVFIDGNKRTGFAAMARFMYLNGYELQLANKEIVDYTVKVATTNPDLADIALWIKEHSKKLGSSN